MRIKWCRKKFGFTLIEILLTVSLFSLCSFAIYKVFAGGVKLWARSQYFAVEEDVAIFLDKFSEDLRNSFYYTGINFKGMQGQLTVPAFVTTQADERSMDADQGPVTQIGAVKYYYDYETHTIHRAQANYSQALKGSFADDRVLVKAVTGLRFIYYIPGAEGVDPYTKMEDVIPSAVYVEIKYNDGRSEQQTGRFISIPVGV